MSARDELAATLADAIECIHGFAAWTRRAPRDLADRLIAAGYTKPRTISTVGELGDLTRNAAVLASNGTVWVNDGDCTEPWACVTEDLMGGPVWADSDGVALPATVLYEPAQ